MWFLWSLSLAFWARPELQSSSIRGDPSHEYVGPFPGGWSPSAISGAAPYGEEKKKTRGEDLKSHFVLKAMMWATQSGKVFNGVCASLGNWPHMMQIDPTPLGTPIPLVIDMSTLPMIAPIHHMFDCRSYRMSILFFSLCNSP